ncbi:MAG: hypothetical protein AAFQ80_20330 [Cyanobacteria bacterium J06621_8]
MSNTVVLNVCSALLLLCFLVGFHFITFAIFTPGLTFFNDLLSFESRMGFYLEIRKNYLYILMYLVPISVNLLLSFAIIRIRIQFNSTIGLGSIIAICFFPWIAYYFTNLITLLIANDISWQEDFNQLFSIRDIIIILPNSCVTAIGGILAYI